MPKIYVTYKTRQNIKFNYLVPTKYKKVSDPAILIYYLTFPLWTHSLSPSNRAKQMCQKNFFSKKIVKSFRSSRLTLTNTEHHLFFETSLRKNFENQIEWLGK